MACLFRNQLTCRIPTRSVLFSRSISVTKRRATPRSPIATTTTATTTAHAIPFRPTKDLRYVSPTIFGLTACGAIFMTAAVVYDRNQVTLWQRLEGYRKKLWWSSSENEPTMKDIWREKAAIVLERKQHMMDRLEEILDAPWIPLDIKRACWLITDKFTSMKESEQTLSVLVGINVIVFGLWQIRRCGRFMDRYFLHHPAANKPITLLTSCFSHQDFFHLACNMVGLYSFGVVLHDYLGREQFLALYLSTGIGANVVSHILGIATRRFRPLLPSLGASGAVYGVLSSTAILNPQASIYCMFIPFVPIQLGYALPLLMGLDVAGILLRWRSFDHYAHLAGAGLGLSYMTYGQQHLWQPLLKKVHEVRSQ
ncbi:hypothetical protein EC973_005423 [Apophysomyces ossiformis]|uniref:Peptidase S54 rhomboid domain-containing protein n=1 Tax=Apophysomyces ossiformis TaxID=679940 RepID=A0A8H7BG36_9FUNG|nr:hypothetical protein EC973_005423 [Apophysomyces ossiformis]